MPLPQNLNLMSLSAGSFGGAQSRLSLAAAGASLSMSREVQILLRTKLMLVDKMESLVEATNHTQTATERETSINEIADAIDKVET